MRRTSITPRPDWQRIVESQGLTFHTVDGFAYWDESAYYTLDERDARALETATNAIWAMCKEAVSLVIQDDLFELVGIAEPFRPMVRESWLRGDRTLYGRLDLAYDGSGPPRLLEFNADTPTALVEASVAQWYWMKDSFPQHDQFNALHERLVETWRSIAPTGSTVHFASMYDYDEDWMTITYLRDTAAQAGLTTVPIAVEDIGWNAAARQFRDEQDQTIHTIFKLYPWEWLLREPFGAHIPGATTRWIEPAWKAILSTKAILPVLWQLFPDSPYLLEASFDALPGEVVSKPIHSREGANIAIKSGARTLAETSGPYDGPRIHQRFMPLRTFDGRTPVIGTWIIGDAMCGVGIREDRSIITRNTSSFVPHVYVP